MPDEPVVPSLEDDAAPTPEAPAPEAVVETAAAAEEGPAEVESVEVGGQRYVPVSAVMAERRQRQELAAKAERVDQLEAWVQQHAPYVEILRQNPHLLQPRQPDPVPAAAGPVDDPDALEAARLMDFYTPEGQPDAARGAKWLDLQERRATKVAQKAMQPLQHQNAAERSALNFQRALQLQDADGQKVDPQVLRNLWQSVSPEQTADENFAGSLAVWALGAQRLTAKPKVPVPAPAVFTEAGGGTPKVAAKMSDLEARIAKERGLDDAKWQERTKGYRAGRMSALEE